MDSILDIDPESKSEKLNLAKVHFLPMVKRYIKNAVKIIIHEMNHYRESWDGPKITVDKHEVFFGLDLNLISQYLSEAYLIFSIGTWAPDFGGEAWAKFAKILKLIVDSTIKLESAINEGDFDSISFYTGDLSAKMNIADNLNHNTGGFLEKLVDLENPGLGPRAEKKADEILKTLLKLMDTKRLTNYEDILPYIKKYIQGNPDAFLYREHLSRLLSKGGWSIERAELELKAIKEKKETLKKLEFILETLHKEDIYFHDLKYLESKNIIDYSKTFNNLKFSNFDHLMAKLKEVFTGSKSDRLAIKIYVGDQIKSYIKENYGQR